MAEFADFEIETDLSGLETYDGAERPLLPVGEYVFTVVNIEQTTGNGKPMIKVESDVVEPVELAGQKAWTNYMLVSKDNTGLKRLKCFMVACGAQLDKFRAGECMGATYRGDIIHTEGSAKIDANGNVLPAKTFANIVKERPMVGGEVASAAPEPPPITKGGKPANVAQNGKPAARRA